MDQSLPVRIRQPAAHLQNNSQFLRHRHRPPRPNHGLERQPLEILHDEIRHPVLVPQFVHGHNVLVMKAAGILRLAIKPDQEIRILRRRGQNLNRNRPPNPRIVPPEHGPHAPAPDHIHNVVSANPRGFGRFHGLPQGALASVTSAAHFCKCGSLSAADPCSTRRVPHFSRVLCARKPAPSASSGQAVSLPKGGGFLKGLVPSGRPDKKPPLAQGKRRPDLHRKIYSTPSPSYPAPPNDSTAPSSESKSSPAPRAEFYFSPHDTSLSPCTPHSPRPRSPSE